MSNVTTTTLNGFFKTVFGPTWLNNISPAGKLLGLFPFDKKNLIGKVYSVPVLVNLEQGFTASAPDQDAFDLNGAISSTTREAQVNAYQLVLQSAFSYEVAAKAMKSATAFLNVMELRMQSMIEGFDRRLLTQCLYGQEGIATTASGTNTSSTSETIVMTDASWAPQIWIGAENATVNFYNGGSLIGTSGADTIFTVSKVNHDTKTVLVTGTSTGCTALHSAIGSALTVYWNGFKSNEMAGISLITGNTATSLFGIDSATYSIWAGNKVTSFGAMSMQKLLSALNKPCGRGLEEDATLLLNTLAWADLNADLHGNRRYQGQVATKTEGGTEAIEYYGQNGKVKIIGSGFVKQGDGILFPDRKVKRVGSVERSFSVPGENEVYFRHLESKAGYEYRIYGAQSMFVEAPSQCLKLEGITAAT